ncbi:SET domain-containing protein SmydA-8 [Schistocerca serialis cubense]|uniref:SET domain-containing protein SmydA-8 n=1 Tax=Schistocerca serialis cubense TaxID=2023355 RepID=UPI00214EAC91|nr:SET domain-containing protein SmydA-8 [Schistocerca serialis cubense]
MAPERCAQCGGEASQRCGGCQQVFYCCRDHQRAHWGTHRPLCRPFKVGQDAVVGRYLCASRDIAAGELVLREPPLVWGPSQATPAVCLGCYVVLEAASCVRCDRCGWPMCSQHCANSLDHRPECDITADVRGAKVSISSFGQEHPTYQCVTALRALRLRTADPARWQKLWALESHCAHRRGTPRYEADRVAVAQFVRRFFKMADFSEEDILRVCGILQVNGHEVPLTEPSYVSVYEWASLLEHSCRANCSKSFSEAGELLLRAAAPIARGQRLTICYSDSLWGTASRRQHLRETKFFWCRCARCTDPTEMGTFFSALRCPQPGCEGVCVPAEESLQQEPEDEQEEPPWWCRSCQQPMPAAQVLQQLEAAGAELSALPRGDAERCWQFVRRHEAAARLSGDHFYLTEARLALAQLLGQGPAGVAALPEDHLRAKEALCRRLLRLVTVLCPAENRVRGVLLCELQAAIAEAARRSAAAGGLDAAAFRQSLKESRELLVEALDLLRYEPEVLPEGKIAEHAREALRDVDIATQRLHCTLAGGLI